MQAAVQEKTLVQQAWLRHRFLKTPCLHLCLQLFWLLVMLVPPPPPLLLLRRHHVLPHRYYVEDAAGPHNFGRKQRPTLKGSQEDGVPACFEDAKSRIYNISIIFLAFAELWLCEFHCFSVGEFSHTQTVKYAPLQSTEWLWKIWKRT